MKRFSAARTRAKSPRPRKQATYAKVLDAERLPVFRPLKERKYKACPQSKRGARSISGELLRQK
jgi:hypothetical protein